VVERVIARLPVPPPELPWREWFRSLLSELRMVLTGYPGVARRLALYGAAAPAAAGIVDRGVQSLQAAGFGDESPMIYRLLLNTACLFVSMEDEQDRNAEVKARNGALLAEFREDKERPGLAAMGQSIHELLANPEQGANYFAEFFDYAVERCLDGVTCRLKDRT
jgi:hypothetical protein